MTKTPTPRLTFVATIVLAEPIPNHPGPNGFGRHGYGGGRAGGTYYELQAANGDRYLYFASRPDQFAVGQRGTFSGVNNLIDWAGRDTTQTRSDGTRLFCVTRLRLESAEASTTHTSLSAFPGHPDANGGADDARAARDAKKEARSGQL